jgi:hypothetical protein
LGSEESQEVHSSVLLAMIRLVYQMLASEDAQYSFELSFLR